jgi:flagellin-like protein
MNNYKRFMKNTKAISPIFATLILIAIAVIAGVVVYMFTSVFLAGNTANTNAGQEKVTIQAASSTATGVTILAQSTSGPNPTVNGIIVKDAGGNVIGSATIAAPPAATDFAGGVLVTIDGAIDLDPGTYTATLTTAAGGSFVSPSFVVA